MKLTTKQLKQFEKQLLAEKDELEQQLASNEHYGLAGSNKEMVGELSAYDNHPADLGTELYERGKDIALNENAEHHLEELEIALENIKAGTYGTCVICGKDIPIQRLKAMPATQFCIDHVPDPNVSERRPIEEEILAPPFGRTSLDELDEQNQFDGEDAWQIVESWGTSNTPAMAEDPNVSDYNDMYIEFDENEGFVEPIESFLATDLYGNVMVVRNKEYHKYMAADEGDRGLEYDYEAKDNLD